MKWKEIVLLFFQKYFPSTCVTKFYFLMLFFLIKISWRRMTLFFFNLFFFLFATRKLVQSSPDQLWFQLLVESQYMWSTSSGFKNTNLLKFVTYFQILSVFKHV